MQPQTLQQRGTLELPLGNFLTSDKVISMSTIRFYIYGLIISIIAVLGGPVHPWAMSFLYINVFWMVFSQFAYVMVIRHNKKSTLNMRRLSTEAIIATIVAVIAATLSLDGEGVGFFSYLLIVASVVEFGVSKLLVESLTPLLPKRERKKR